MSKRICYENPCISQRSRNGKKQGEREHLKGKMES